jgi:hypothetical protein
MDHRGPLTCTNIAVNWLAMGITVGVLDLYNDKEYDCKEKGA